MKTIEKIHIPFGKVSPDIFALPCITGAYKSLAGIITYQMQGGQLATSGQVLCKDESGRWFAIWEGKQ